jgi:NADH-quinone oxidoreductase subunit M
LIGFFVIGGVPPTVGFMSKFMIFTGVFENALSGSMEQLFVAIISIIMTVLTVGYSLWTMRRIFFGPVAEGMENVKEAPMLMLVPMAVFAVIAILLGVYPRLVTDYLLPFFGA